MPVNIPKTTIDAQLVNNVEMYNNDVLITDTISFINGSTNILKLVAKGGYLIESATYRTGTGGTKQFTINEGGKNATSNLQSSGATINLAVNTIIDPNYQTPTIKGNNSIYEMLNADDFRLLSSKIWKSNIADDTTVYNDFFIGAIKLPFKISDDMIIKQEQIELGRVNTEINANRLNSDFVMWDLGEIRVDEVFGNFTDYDCSCILHLPYVLPFGIDSHYCIGETIKIRMKISLYDGSANVIVESTKIDGVCLEKNVQLSIKIPYATISNNPNDTSNLDLMLENEIKTSFLEVARNNLTLADGAFSTLVTDEKVLKGESGFVIIDEVDLNGNANSQEKADIIALLKNGVFIND